MKRWPAAFPVRESPNDCWRSPTKARWTSATSASPAPVTTDWRLKNASISKQMVLHVPNEELADGLQQWPATRSFIKARLGPEALVIEEAEAEAFEERLRSIGITLMKE